MFETVELGNTMDKATFKEKVVELRTQLLHIQNDLMESNIPVVVIVSGVEGSGKPRVVNRLNEWLDARGIQTHAFWDESDEERERPRFWRFWRKLPPRGTIGIMFGSWYTQPIIQHTYNKIDEAEFEFQMQRINDFEQMLSADGALIVKLWFHIPKEEQQQRIKLSIKDKKRKGRALTAEHLQKKFLKKYDRFVEVSEEAIRHTDSGFASWHLIEATDDNYRDYTTGLTLLHAITARLEQMRNGISPVGETLTHTSLIEESPITVLDTVDLTRTIGGKVYRNKLDKLQGRYEMLSWAAREKRVSSINMFEGWDAAGKGGAIRRLTGALDARLYRVISVASPTDEEKAQHHLWRFWRHLPRAGYITIYDRSWYGRVLVERVEKFATEQEWGRGYLEINQFEQQLAEAGMVLNKFWVHISPEEQLARFKEREKISYKQYKITDEDWRNRERWDDYRHAINDMVARTSTSYAPWHIISGNDKKVARLEVLKVVCERLEEKLEG